MNGKTMLNGVPYFSDTQVIELTRAEYDSLPNSKYMDGVLYCIKDEGVMKGDTFSPIIYSLAEREIGVWTDGKPLYQKSITIPISSQTGDIVYTVDSGLSVVNAIGIIKTTGGFEMVLPASYSNIFYCGLQHDSNNIRLSIYSSSSWQQYNTLTEATVTYQYTKITDNPGTGKWTTSGVPAHHYSTDEQVIGTWFGETLYEKTAIVSYTDFVYDANVSNGRSYNPYNVIENNANLINIYPIAISNLYKITPGFSINNYDSSNNYWGLKMTYNKVVLYSSGGWTIIENHVKPTVYITIQYTKSS